MKQFTKKLVAPSLLLASLVYPYSLSGAQSASIGQRYAHPTKTSKAAGTPTATKVKRATLKPAQIKTIRTTEGIKSAVTIKGYTISPKVGVSLWAVENGSFVVITDSNNPTPMSQVILENKPFGVIHFYVCLCVLRGGRDACRFQDGFKDAAHCGGQSCCGFHEGEIAADGSLSAS